MKCEVQDLETTFNSKYMVITQTAMLNKHRIRVMFRYYYGVHNKRYEIVIDDVDRIKDFIAHFSGDWTEQKLFINWMSSVCEYNSYAYSDYSNSYFQQGYVRVFRKKFPKIMNNIFMRLAEYDGIM